MLRKTEAGKYPTGEDRTSPYQKLMAIAGIGIVASTLAACGPAKTVEGAPRTEPVATAPETPGPSPSPEATESSTVEQTPSPSPNETTASEKERNPNVRIFEEEYKKHYLTLTPEKVRKLVWEERYEEIAYILALGTYYAGENNSTFWNGGVQVNPGSKDVPFWNDTESMNPDSLAKSTFLPLQLAFSATEDPERQLSIDDDINGTQVPLNTTLAESLLDLHYQKCSGLSWCDAAYNSTVNNITDPGATVGLLDYSELEGSKIIDRGTLTIKKTGKAYSTVTLQIPDFLKKDGEDRGVVYLKVILAPLNTTFIPGSGRSEWEDVRGAHKGIGLINHNEAGQPLTPDGKPVLWPLPYEVSRTR